MIRQESDGALRTITIDRPDRANALTSDMLRELIRLTRATADAKCVIYTGRGKVFSAGADLDEARAGLATSPLWGELCSAIAALPCLTIAAINGTLAGGANGLALACDMRVAVPNAKFFYPVMRLGFLPQPADVERMRALIGPARTKVILMGGQKISAQEALEFGLIDRIAEDVLTEAHSLTETALGATPDHIAAIKRMIDAPA